MRAAAQWVVKDDLLVESKLNSYEKTKKAKAGLAVMDTLEELAAQAKAKGGAQYLDEEDINIRLKWLGLFHRLKYVPGTFMQRFKCPNGSFTLKQWRVRCARALSSPLSPLSLHYNNIISIDPHRPQLLCVCVRTGDQRPSTRV